MGVATVAGEGVNLHQDVVLYKTLSVLIHLRASRHTDSTLTPPHLDEADSLSFQAV
jgi:hypothetical protein